MTDTAGILLPSICASARAVRAVKAHSLSHKAIRLPLVHGVLLQLRLCHAVGIHFVTERLPWTVVWTLEATDVD